MDNVIFIRRQKELIEELFDIEWLKKYKTKHPAASRWALCVEILKQGGAIRWPNQKDKLKELATLVLDGYSFITLSSGNLKEFKIGDISGYGDKSVQKKINSRLPDPRQFDSLMLELSIAAWHQGSGHQIEPLEEKGLPDLRLKFQNSQKPFYIECKRLTASSKSGIQKRIRLANKQLKTVDEDSYGIVILDISGSVETKTVIKDEIPEDVEEILNYAQQAILGQKNRSVSRIIVIWDDMEIKVQPPNKTFIFTRRNIKHLDHEKVDGVSIIDNSGDLYKGNTVGYTLSWDTSLTNITQIKLTDQVVENKKKFDFSDDELIDFFNQRDKLEQVNLGEKTDYYLFSKRTTWKEKPSLVLALGSKDGETFSYLFAFRLPSKIMKDVELLTPIEMLALFANNYGLPFKIGGKIGKFICQEKISLPKNVSKANIVHIINPNNHSFMQSMMIKFEESSTGIIVNCGIAFAINTTKLFEDLDIKTYR